MKAFVASVMALASVAQSTFVAPLQAGLAPYNLGLGYAGLGYAAPVNYAAAPALAAAPVAYAAGPALAAAPALTYAAAAPTIASSQFQKQDEFANYAYGYNNINSAKQEAGNAYGGVTGSYSYIDANGLPQTTNYVADGLGFRVQSTQLPVAPVANLAQPVHTLSGPVDTPEVAAAKADFFAKFEEAKLRTKRSLPLAYGYGGYALGGYAPALAAPLSYAAPTTVGPAPVAGIPARLITVQNTPGHAVSYQVL